MGLPTILESIAIMQTKLKLGRIEAFKKQTGSMTLSNYIAIRYHLSTSISSPNNYQFSKKKSKSKFPSQDLPMGESCQWPCQPWIIHHAPRCRCITHRRHRSPTREATTFQLFIQLGRRQHTRFVQTTSPWKNNGVVGKLLGRTWMMQMMLRLEGSLEKTSRSLRKFHKQTSLSQFI